MDFLDKLKMDGVGFLFTLYHYVAIPFKWFWKLSFWNKVFIVFVLLAVFDNLRYWILKLIVEVMLLF